MCLALIMIFKFCTLITLQLRFKITPLFKTDMLCGFIQFYWAQPDLRMAGNGWLGRHSYFPNSLLISICKIVTPQGEDFKGSTTCKVLHQHGRAHWFYQRNPPSSDQELISMQREEPHYNHIHHHIPKFPSPLNWPGPVAWVGQKGENKSKLIW